MGTTCSTAGAKVIQDSPVVVYTTSSAPVELASPTKSVPQSPGTPTPGADNADNFSKIGAARYDVMHGRDVAPPVAEVNVKRNLAEDMTMAASPRGAANGADSAAGGARRSARSTPRAPRSATTPPGSCSASAPASTSSSRTRACSPACSRAAPTSRAGRRRRPARASCSGSRRSWPASRCSGPRSRCTAPTGARRGAGGTRGMGISLVLRLYITATTYRIA